MSYNDPATDPPTIYDVSCILCGKAYKIYEKALAARDLAYNDATANFSEAESIYLAAYAALNKARGEMHALMANEFVIGESVSEVPGSNSRAGKYGSIYDALLAAAPVAYAKYERAVERAKAKHAIAVEAANFEHAEVLNAANAERKAKTDAAYAALNKARGEMH